MRMSFSLTDIIGVTGAVVDTETSELVAGWFLIPEAVHKIADKKLMENKLYSIMEDTTLKAKVNCGFCFLDQERKVSDTYRGYQSLYINHRASFKNAALERQYFLVHDLGDGQELLTLEAKEEAYEAALKKMFFERSLKKLPLTIATEWEIFTWNYLKQYFKPLLMIGKTPYGRAFVLDLPNATVLQNVVERSHASFEFHSRFKRVPKIAALLAVCDIENFDFKEWQAFLTNVIGGQETFEAMQYERQEALVRAFELFGNDTIALERLETWHSTNLKNVNILVRMAADKNAKNSIKNGFKKTIDMCINSEQSGYIYPVVNSFEKIWKDHQASISNNNFTPIKAFIDSIQYENVIIGAQELANVCAIAKVSEAEFKMFQTQYLDHLDRILVAPRAYPTVANRVNDKIQWELLDMSVPRAWTVGIETHCCMHPMSVGGSCLLYAAKNPETSGILRITENGKTIAQSFTWLGAPDKDGQRTLVLDNIETLGSNLRDSVRDAYLDFAVKMEKYAKLFGFKAITIGSGCSDMHLATLTGQAEPVERNSRFYAPKPETMGYYDANTQWLLTSFEAKEAK